MNIHFTDIELFEKLKAATIAKIKVGSHMYGTNNENSDIDYLYIYATSKNELNSCFTSHHQLQYIEDGVDHNFVSLHNFIKNCISGDSTINFEVIHSNTLNDTSLKWITKFKNSFITYTVIRSYLGLARRDIKHFYKYTDEYSKRKRLGHVVRGYIYARYFIKGNFNFESANLELSRTNLDVSDSKMLKTYELKISELRDELNSMFNNKNSNIAKKFNVNDGIKFTEELNKYLDSFCFSQKQNILKDFNTDSFINSFENWVEY